jgi:alpha-galactosidase
MVNDDYQMLTFDGAWSKERHLHEKPLTPGIFINDSKCGSSSNKHNPFFILKQRETTEDANGAYGFNLVYSGNHTSILEVTPLGKVRVLMGLNPHATTHTLAPQTYFMTPEAVMTYSSRGLIVFPKTCIIL